MSTRTLYTVILLVVLAIVCFAVLKFLVKKAIFKVLVVAVLIFVFVGGGKIISLNTLPAQIEQRVNEAAEELGASSIKTEGSKVLVKINDQWYDVAKLSYVGKLATDDIVLNYDGKEIKIGHSGVVNTLKVLEDVGLIGGD